MTKIHLLDGKYTIQHENGANFKALRYGEEWRDLTGDGLVLALVQRIEELEEIVNKPTVVCDTGWGESIFSRRVCE